MSGAELDVAAAVAVNHNVKVNDNVNAAVAAGMAPLTDSLRKSAAITCAKDTHDHLRKKPP